jgi:magnesium-transporting ATPase (P-type)
LLLNFVFWYWFSTRSGFATILLASVALGVAVVPEGLTANKIVTMMAGIRKLIKKNVLVRKMIQFSIDQLII